MNARVDPVTDLVRIAIGCGVMMALEDRDALLAKLQQLPVNGVLADALTEDAKRFLGTRLDLVEDVIEHFRDLKCATPGESS